MHNELFELMPKDGAPFPMPMATRLERSMAFLSL